MKNVGEFDVCLEEEEIKAELTMTRNNEEKFKWLEFKVEERLHKACYVEEGFGYVHGLKVVCF